MNIKHKFALTLASGVAIGLAAETAFSWSQTGPQGQPGPTGSAGPAGPAGPAGSGNR